MTPQEAKQQLVILIEELWSNGRDDAEPIVEQLQYSEGDVVLAKNQQDDDLYYIQQGEVRIARARQGTHELSITLSAGDLIGELSFLSAAKRSATVLASMPTICLRISAERFKVWLEDNALLAASLYHCLGVIISERLIASGVRGQFRQFFDGDSAHITQKIARYRFSSLSQKLYETESAYEALRLPISLRSREAIRALQKQAEDSELSAESLHVKEAEILTRETVELEKAQVILSEVVKSIFDEIESLLSKISDVHQRTENGRIGFELFYDQLHRAPVVTELIAANRSESTYVWTQFLTEGAATRDPVINLINAELQSKPTIAAYRESLALVGRLINVHVNGQPPKVTLLNDLTGSVFGLLFPRIARLGGEIHFVTDDRHAFTSVEYRLSRYGKASYTFQLVEQLSSLDASTLRDEPQNTIIAISLADYLSDGLLYQFLTQCKSALTSDGKVILSFTRPSSDECLFCDFLGWSTIRRNKSDMANIAHHAGFQVVEAISSLETPACIVVLSV